MDKFAPACFGGTVRHGVHAAFAFRPLSGHVQRLQAPLPERYFSFGVQTPEQGEGPAMASVIAADTDGVPSHLVTLSLNSMTHAQEAWRLMPGTCEHLFHDIIARATFSAHSAAIVAS